ncbi:DUF4326 domain-containing protein [Microbacterium arborescens]
MLPRTVDISHLTELHSLRGKRLGCHCAPPACRGDVLKKWAEE